MTSPPARVEIARKVMMLTLSLMNCTCPSRMQDVHSSGMEAARADHGGVAAGVGAVRVFTVRRVEMVIGRHDEAAARPFAAPVS